jgi:SH3 domain-containing YSC84-like protein 1
MKASAGLGLATISLIACSTSNMQGASSAAEADRKEKQTVDDRLANATDSIPQFRSNTPDSIAERPKCVVMIPGLIKAGFVVGGSGGKGFAACKLDTGTGWSPPAPVSVGGGSIGLQAGADASDWLMLVMTDKAKNALFQGHFKIGVDASATAGPVGTGAGAATDVQGGDTISYSRSRGLFAGAVLNGATLDQDDTSTHALYGKSTRLRDILGGMELMPSDEGAMKFTATVRKAYSGMPFVSSSDVNMSGMDAGAPFVSSARSTMSGMDAGAPVTTLTR